MTGVMPLARGSRLRHVGGERRGGVGREHGHGVPVVLVEKVGDVREPVVRDPDGARRVVAVAAGLRGLPPLQQQHPHAPLGRSVRRAEPGVVTTHDGRTGGRWQPPSSWSSTG
jgi:hypothetical protein